MTLLLLRIEHCSLEVALTCSASKRRRLNAFVADKLGAILFAVVVEMLALKSLTPEKCSA